MAQVSEPTKPVASGVCDFWIAAVWGALACGFACASAVTG
jgi:hypothetical protein